MNILNYLNLLDTSQLSQPKIVLEGNLDGWDGQLWTISDHLKRSQPISEKL